MHRPPWLLLLRWHMVVMVSVVAFAMGILGADGHLTTFLLERILLSVVLLVAVGIGADLQNWACEWNDDLLHAKKQDRPIPSGEIAATAVLSVAILLWMGALSVSVWFFPPVYTLCIIGTIVTAFLYSEGGLVHWKDGLVTNGLAIAAPRAFFGPLAGFVGGGGSPLSPAVWTVIAITVFTIVLGGEIRNVGPDEQAGDLAANVKTFSNVFGARAGWMMTLSGFLLAPVVAVALFPSNLLLYTLFVPFGLFLAEYVTKAPMKVCHVTYHLGFTAMVAVVVVALLFRS